MTDYERPAASSEPWAARGPRLLARILGRDRSLFADAVVKHRDDLRHAIGGARVLVIGAGGSIGASFVKVLAPYCPAALHPVDLSEDNLVALVRDPHAQESVPPAESAVFAIGFDESDFFSYLRQQAPFDYILDFAALKHVRYECQFADRIPQKTSRKYRFRISRVPSPLF